MYKFEIGSSWDQRHEEYNRVQQMLMPKNVAPTEKTIQMGI
jgi:hypothetical protein